MSDPPQILVVDDEPVSRLMTSAGLERAGYRTVEAESGIEALQHFREQSIQVVVLDLMMPGMDGFEVCREIRKAPDGEYIPVLVMTGLDDDDSVSRAYEAGATDFIGKPFSDVVMAQRVRYLIRTQLMQQALADSEKVARSAARAKSIFLANMSHEIRTPMNGVLGLLEQIEPADLKPVDRDRVETAIHSAEQLLAIIDDVLDVTRIDSGQLNLEAREMVPGDIVEDICALLLPAARDKGIRLSCIVDESAFATCAGDAMRVRQVVTNLVGNAVKFTDSGKVSVTACFDVGGLEVQVEDTGIGIPDAARERMFDEFDQLDASTTRRYGGTGLGLAIAKSLIDLMSGTIAVTSEVGVGSSFTLRLPLMPCEIARPLTDTVAMVVGFDASETGLLTRRLTGLGASCADDMEAADLVLIDAKTLSKFSRKGSARLIVVADGACDDLPTHASLWLRPFRRRRLLELAEQLRRDDNNRNLAVGAHPVRILVAEDNPINQKVATGALERLSYSYDLVENGSEAVSALDNAEYDLVLMDCHMPQMDGYEATRRIREAERVQHRRRVPIIALTANAMPDDVKLCLAAGMDGHMAKPFRMQSLKEQVERWTA